VNVEKSLDKRAAVYFTQRLFLYNENPAIVAGFHVGFADEKKTNKKVSAECSCGKGSLV